ncbi:CitMHS family transporter [Kroppenstedtia pulmonis]|uniref:CitMHS family transporter n=1 Tax=Kroppenstedtia pulmonis TaxID=1380685 RepID=UPI001FE4EA15|nr:citrate:proton symporter [Kroppenstedtia pulmonis]
MLSFVGFSIIITIVFLLLTEKTSPMVSLIIVPILGAFVAGFGVAEISGFFEKGISSVIQVVIMFVFAILFFGIMKDAGLFEPLIQRMIAVSQGNVVTVAVGTVIIAAIAHLDGAGASTFLLVVPALLQLYKRLHMNPYLLFLLIAASTGIVNMMPWGGPVGRAAAILEVSPTSLWKPLIPLQVIGIVLVIILAFMLGVREQRRIAQKKVPFQKDGLTEKDMKDQHDSESHLRRPKLFWINAVLVIAVLTVLISETLPPGYIFMIGASLALILNYPKSKDQMERIKAHAPGAMMMAGIILAAGTFLGILSGSKMLDSIATSVVYILPGALIPYLHVIIGIFGVPFDLLLSTDAYYFALLPVVDQIVSSAGVSSLSIAYAMIIGNIVGTFVSPFSPALWLGLGLANLSMGRHIRYSFFLIWALAVVMIIISMLMGIVRV